MADDNNKKLDPQGNEEQSGKGWDWDAQVPETTSDDLDLSQLNIPEKEETIIEAPAEEDEKAEESKADAPAESGCCIICGEKLRNSPSELYCDVCREKFLKVNFSASHIIISIVMMIVAVISIVSFVSTSQITKNIVEGDSHLENGHISRAVDSYYAVDTTVANLNDGFNAFLKGISANFDTVTVYDSGTAVDKKVADIMVNMMSSAYTDREALISVVESSFTEKELNSEEYAHIKECYDFCKAMDSTANSIYDKWGAMVDERLAAYGEDGKLTSEDVPEIDEILAVLDDYAKKNPDAEPSTIDYYKVMTYYFEATYSNERNNEQIMKYMNSTYEKAGKFGYFYANDYLSTAFECEDYDSLIRVANEVLEVNPANEAVYYYLTKAYGNQNDWNKASETCESLIKYNPDSLDYYILKAEVLRRQGDYSASIDICKKGLKVGEDAELYRQEAISYMLNEETDKALEMAKAAYEVTYAASYSGGNVSLEVLNTAALISYLCDDNKTIYNEIVESLDAQNYHLEESVMSVIKGDSTFEDLFTAGKGDI